MTAEHIYDNIQMLWEVTDTLKEQLDRIERALPSIDQDLSFNPPQSVAMLAKRLWKMEETIDRAINKNDDHQIADLPDTVQALNNRLLNFESVLKQHPELFAMN